MFRAWRDTACEDGGMAHDGELFSLGDWVASEPSFELAFRGYNQKQVDQYFQVSEAEKAALAGERDSAFEQIQGLAAQVQALQHELTEARRRGSHSPGVPSQVSFRHLGPRVEQILAMAEEQADQIRADAVSGIETDRAEAAKLLADARDQHSQAIRDFEAVLAARRAEEEQAAQARREQLAADVENAQQHAARLRQ